jgi:ATP-binding cassette subfamily F protein 3
MLLSLNDVGFEFGARTILQNADWHIYVNERIGLIGPNGTGKSTLLKILVGEYSVTSGLVNRAKNLKIGYFHQDLQSLDTFDSIHKVAMSAFEDALRIEKELEELNVKLEKEITDKLLERQGDLIHEFEMAGGYEMEHKSAQILEGLGFPTAHLSRPYNEFSGGWRMRVLLARMILQKPDILLLDEPTNHLDLPSIEWMERYLSNYDGTVIIVSHDRYFLDRMVTKVVEVSQQTLNSYSGNYAYYEQEKELRKEFQLREFDNQQDYIRQQERFVERFKAKASKAAQAQSIVKRLDRLERVEAPISETAKINFNFIVGTQPGKIISTIKNVSKSYGDLNILNKTSAEIVRGDKIALIGANGKGKSTLLRLIAEQETCDGTIEIGHNVEKSFYAQHQLEALDVENEILNEMKLSGSGKTDLELRELMGCFLFKGDDIFKKIKVLSGGEKARVALAKTIVSKGNFLLLDEPTNHLDFTTVSMLIKAINKFTGTCIIVSHDRYFIQGVANKIWEIVDGEINEFEGTYDEWEQHKKRLAEKKNNKEIDVKKTPEPVKVAEQKPIVQNVSIDKEKQKEELRVKTLFEKIENELEQLKKNKAQLEADLGNPDIYADKSKFLDVETKYKTVASAIATKQQEYETTFEQLLSFE